MPTDAIATALGGWAKRRRPSRLWAALAALLLAGLGVLLPVLLAIRLTPEPDAFGPRRVEDLLNHFARHGYDLARVAAGEAAVPRLFLDRLPVDWRGIAPADERKRAFIMAVLPLVLSNNETILAERRRLLDLEAQIRDGRPLTKAERDWLQGLAERYDLDPAGPVELGEQVDIVPPSLAIAQAAIESGWGTSRFATEGNALYGEWTEQDESTMVPAGREAGRTYAIRSFPSLSGSVAAYMKNLNTHRAYRKFRAARSAMRRQGRPLDGAKLAQRLGAYAQQGGEYVRTLQAIIAENGLASLDQAVFAPSRP